MPRDPNGAYSLPSGTIVSSGQTIQPSQHNPAMNDIAAALSQSLSRTGQGGLQADLNMNGFGITNGGTLVGQTVGVDAKFYASIEGSNPRLLFDDGDFLIYDRATNTYTFNIGSAGKLGISNTAITASVPLTGVTVTSGTVSSSAIAASNTVNDTGTISATSPGFRGLPVNSPVAGTYNFVLSDAGKVVVRNSSGSLGIVPFSSVAFPAGTAITIINNSGAPIALNAGSGVFLIWAGTGSVGNRTLAHTAVVTIINVSTDGWYLSGSGIS